MNVNLEWYRVFYWTAKTGSLTGAAARLNITQPAVSHTLKQLEEALGGPLFFRTSKGVRLTSEGEALFRHIEQAFIHVSLGEKTIVERHNLENGEIRIGASDTLCSYYLLPYLEQFHERYPGIRIHITNRTTPETLQLLKEGKIDFGIVSLLAADKQIDFLPTIVVHDCLVGSKKFSSLGNDALPISALSSHPLLLLESGSTRQFIDKFAAAHQTRIVPEFELGSVDLLIQFALRGFGLAFVVREFIEKELQSGDLIAIKLEPPLPERPLGIASLHGIPLSSAAKAFKAMLLQADSRTTDQ